MGNFYGVNTTVRAGSPNKQIKGFAGVKVSYSGVPVVVRDARGRGLSGVTLYAPNSVSGLPFEAQTDGNGGALMSIDNSSTLYISKGTITKEFSYTSETKLSIVLDTIFMQGIDNGTKI